MSERWVISLAYGRCIEGANAAQAAYWIALANGDEQEMAACLRDRADWNRLAAETPRFMEQPA